jgi:hypothetical protein
MLALHGDADDSLSQFLALLSGDAAALRFWDESRSDWAPLTSASNGVDYTLEYLALGDLAGYTLLTVGIPELSGDYNADGIVDGADHSVWKAAFGSTSELTADGNADGIVDAADYVVWRNALSQVASSVAGSRASVPEPATALLWIVACVMPPPRSLRLPPLR